MIDIRSEQLEALYNKNINYDEEKSGDDDMGAKTVIMNVDEMNILKYLSEEHKINTKDLTQTFFATNPDRKIAEDLSLRNIIYVRAILERFATEGYIYGNSLVRLFISEKDIFPKDITSKGLMTLNNIK